MIMFSRFYHPGALLLPNYTKAEKHRRLRYDRTWKMIFDQISVILSHRKLPDYKFDQDPTAFNPTIVLGSKSGTWPNFLSLSNSPGGIWNRNPSDCKIWALSDTSGTQLEFSAVGQFGRFRIPFLRYVRHLNTSVLQTVQIWFWNCL